MKFTAAGDLLIQRCLPVDGHYDGFGRVRDFICQGDFRFANIEGTVHQYECPPSEESGGSWLCITPDILDSIKAFGFNMYALANNHSLDYSFEGVAKTLEYTRRAGLKTAGTGMTLSEASEPVYLDCRSGRIALIAATSTFKRYAMAGAQSAQMMGRPGVNGIRIQETFLVTPEEMDALKRIAEGTAINAYRDIIRKEGYLPQLAADTFEFGTLMFKMSDKTGRQSSVNEQDMKRVEKAIFDARLQADAIVVSLHAHEISGTSKETPDYFIQEFARRSIDAGAHAVVGSDASDTIENHGHISGSIDLGGNVDLRHGTLEQLPIASETCDGCMVPASLTVCGLRPRGRAGERPAAAPPPCPMSRNPRRTHHQTEEPRA